MSDTKAPTSTTDEPRHATKLHKEHECEQSTPREEKVRPRYRPAHGRLLAGLPHRCRRRHPNQVSGACARRKDILRKPNCATSIYETYTRVVIRRFLHRRCFVSYRILTAYKGNPILFSLIRFKDQQCIFC